MLSQFSESEMAWEMGLAALFLMTTYGGVGRRSRRGWGSLIMKQITPLQNVFPRDKQFVKTLTSLMAQEKMTLADWKAYRDWVNEKAILSANTLCESLQLNNQAPNVPSNYPLIIPKNQSGIMDRLDRGLKLDPIEAITYFGEQEHDFLVSEKPQNPAVFDAFGYAKGRDRWASPLWVRVLPVWDSRKGKRMFALAFSVLESKAQGSDYSVIEKFLNEKFPSAVKVALR